MKHLQTIYSNSSVVKGVKNEELCTEIKIQATPDKIQQILTNFLTFLLFGGYEINRA